MSEAELTKDPPKAGSMLQASEDILRVVVRRFGRPESRLLPKHARLYRAFFEAISRGDIKPHTQIPAEAEVASRFGVSLGTAQRGLKQLAQDGLVSRRQGHGTFVAERQIPEEELWQFRFLRESSSPGYLPVIAKLRTVRHEAEYGRWSTVLGEDPAGFVYIERLIEVDQSALCLSRMYLPASRFGSVLAGRLIEVNPINVKLLLRNEFGAHTTATQQVIRFVKLNREQAGLLDQDADCTTIQLEATGLDQNALPITYHEVIIPPSNFLLDITFSGTPRRADRR
jgi:GntR family transcriptional regulator